MSTMSIYRDSIDAAAEREGAAIEWFEQELGIPEQRSKLAIEREQRTEALRRGLSLKAPKYCYQKVRAIATWIKICDRHSTGKIGTGPRRRYYWLWDTQEIRKAREVRRVANGGRLIHPKVAKRTPQALAKLQAAGLPPESLLRISEISRNFGLAQRTLYRASKKGKLQTVPVEHQGFHGPLRLVRVSALEQYIKNHISAVAA